MDNFFTPQPGPGSDTTAIHDNVAGEIAAIAVKASPVNADIVIIEDSEDSDNKKKASLGNLGTDEKVAVHSGETPGYLGVAGSDGVLRVGNGIGYTDGGAFVTLALTTLTSDWDIGDGRKIILDEIEGRDSDGLTIDGKSGSQGGAITIDAGGSIGGTNKSGDLNLYSGDGDENNSGDGGDIVIYAGNSGGNGNNAGNISIRTKSGPSNDGGIYIGIGSATTPTLNKLILEHPTGNSKIEMDNAGLIKLDTAVNSAQLTVQPTGTIALAIATTGYADSLFAANDAMVYKGSIDCSTNPNYPAADAGHTYRCSVAGKIGGASGVNVEFGDLMICIVDSSPSGDQATVGANWDVLQVNLDGAVIGPASSTDTAIALYDGATGKLIKNSAVTIDTNGTINIPSGETYDINGTPLAKGDIGLGNVTNEAQIAKSIGTAKGDIVGYSASGTPVRLPVGANGEILTADSAESSGMKWTGSEMHDHGLLENPTAGDSLLIGFRINAAKTLSKVVFHISGGTNVVCQLQECDDADGTNAANTQTTDSTVTGTTIVTSFSNAAADAGDYWLLKIPSVSGEVDNIRYDAYYS